ncbi:MAG TPA: hypothetical protein VFI42_18105 [Thermomicrobiaceae bacterium]|nr:hypothetical protein [Thermomicrobiaceae bacterium]
MHALSALLALALLCVLTPPALADSIATPSPTSDWRIGDVSLTPEAPAAGDVATVRFSVRDTQGAPVPHLSVSAKLRTADTAHGDAPADPILTTTGHELPAPGSYEVLVAVNETGSWWLDIVASDALRQASFSRLLTVDPVKPPTTPANDQDPVFLRGDALGAYYRLDPRTGSVARLSGEGVSQAGGAWWITAVHLTPNADPDPLYGGSWELQVSFADALRGQRISSVDLGAIRAGVYVGSSDQPAIATAVALAPDGAHAYVYWSRQLGAGWTSWVALVDPRTGVVLRTRLLTGGIVADGEFARLAVSDDSRQLLIAEQVIQGAQAAGYRLTRLDADTLETLSQVRRTGAGDDPLATCVIPYPGPVGALPGSDTTFYSLCTPTGSSDPALVIWDAVSGSVVHRVDLGALAGGAASFVDGVATPDGRRFYAVNTVTRQVAEIDLGQGQLQRTVSFGPDPKVQSPSNWNRFFDWLLGMVAPPAAAGVLIEHGVAIAPDGSALYVVSPAKTGSGGYGDGVWEVDSQTLQATRHLLTGQPVAGVVVAPHGRLAVIASDQESDDSQISLVQPDGQVVISLTLPDDLSATIGAR